MMRILLASLVLLTASAAPAAEVGLALEPISGAVMGAPVPVTLRVTGAPGGEVIAMLHYRGSSEREFRAMPLAIVSEGVYGGEVAGEVTAASLGLRYFVEVAWNGSPGVALGSAEHPFEVDLQEALPAQVTASTRIGIGFSVLFVFAVTLRWRERAKRIARRDRLFWSQHLLPLLRMDRRLVAAAITRLTRTPLDHPAKGMTMFPRSVILAKLREVAAMDVDRLSQDFIDNGSEDEVPTVTANHGRTAAKTIGKARRSSSSASWRVDSLGEAVHDVAPAGRGDGRRRPALDSK